MKLHRLGQPESGRRALSWMVGLACALLGGHSAFAQVNAGPLAAERQTGSALYTKPKNLDDPEASARFSKFVASCALQRAEGTMRKFVHYSDPVSANLAAADLPWHRIRHVLEQCMADRSHRLGVNASLSKVGMSFTMSRLRALLVEEIYLKDNGSAPFISLDTPEGTDRQFVSSGKDLERARGLAAFADCLVYRDVSRADALLRTEPGSSDEAEVSRALVPELSNCLMEGQTIAFSPSSIRALAADGLWARSAAASAIVE